MLIIKRTFGVIKRWVPILIRYFFGYISLILFHKDLYKKDIWLITEKPGEARDNGYHLFKYIRTNHPEINAYFVIPPNATDRKKVEQYDNIIKYNSKKHMLYYLAAKYSINSQSCGAYPYEMIPTIFNVTKIFRRRDQKCVFLQHGIINNFMPDKKMFHSSKIHDLFVTTTKQERDFVIEKYGYPDSYVKQLGLCRLDALHDIHNNKENIILVMPTWRSWLNKSLSSFDDAQKAFNKSEYYRAYKSFLSNKNLLSALETHEYKLVFYPHFALQQYIGSFEELKNDRVVIASKNDYDVQDLLIKSRILVTDYSSVFFDFAYMNKPLIYYQFDKERFREGHYQEGYFSYNDDGFGKVTVQLDDVINEIEHLLNRDCAIEEKYQERIELFFDLRDNNNCKRTFEAIKSL